MLDIIKLQEQLQKCNYSEIAKKTGLTRSYISALANGTRLNPTYDTIKKIEAAINESV